MTFKENINHYTNQLKKITEKAVFVDKEHKIPSWSDFDQMHKSEILFEILCVIKKILPDKKTRDILKKFYYKGYNELPFDPNNFTFDGLKNEGSSSLVYLLKNKETNGISWVFKIIKDEYIKKFSSIEEAGKFLMQELNEIKSWYTEDLADEIFLPEFLIQLKGPNNQKSLAILQPFKYKNLLRDIFTEIDQNEFTEIMKRNDNLCSTFIKFSEQTINHATLTKKTLDLIGNKNVVIFDNQKLIILDPHFIHSTKNEPDGSSENTQKRLGELRQKQYTALSVKNKQPATSADYLLPSSKTQSIEN